MIFLRIALLLGLSACAAGSYAQITFRGAATAVAVSGTLGPAAYGSVGTVASDSGNCPQSMAPGIPAGTAAGDMLILAIASKDDNAITVSGTWSSLYADVQGTTYQVAIYWKIAVTGETAPTVGKTGATCNVMLGRITRFTGVDTVTPFDGGVGASFQNSSNVVTGSLTTTVATDMLVIVAASADDSDTSVPGGFTEPWESVTTTGTDVSAGLKYQLQATAGAKGPFTFSKTRGADPNHGVLFALRPARASLTINVPAGTVANDVMVATIAVRPNTVLITPPAGWTTLSTIAQAVATANEQVIYYRVAGAAEPASYTWLFESAHTGAAGSIVSYSGVDTATPIDASGGNVTPQGTDGSLLHRALGVTTTTVDTMVLSTHSLASAEPWTPPAGMTERVDISSQAAPSNNGISLEVNEVAQPGIGATGDKIASVPANGDTGVAQIVALRTKFLAPVLELAMDEASWTGAAGEIADTSGNGLNGQSMNGAVNSSVTPAISGNPGTCRYGKLDGVDDFVQVANNALLNITDELTVMAWVRPNSWPAAGALKTIASKDNNYEFHLNSTGKVDWWWGGAPLELISAGSVPTGAWTHVTIVYSRSGGYQRIYFNGLQDANTNNQAGALATNGLPFQVGADQGAAGRFFDGLVDEVRVFHQALGPGRIAAYMNTTRPCPAFVDHYLIGHGGTGIACVDQNITITAHDASHNAVDAGGATLSITTTNGKGSWVGIIAGGGALTDTTPGDGTATYTFAAGASTATLAFRYANLSASTDTFGFNVTDGSHSETTGSAVPLTDDPPFTMVQSGFQFRNVTDGDTTIPLQIAGKPSSTGYNAKILRIQAIQTNTLTGSCTALFANQTRTVPMGAECNSPAACAGRAVVINATAIPTSNDNGTIGAASYGNVSLAFNASSEADTVVTYPDAGMISLHAQYDLDPAIAGSEMLGSSNAFVVRPFGIAFSGMGHAAAPAPAGSAFKAAGDSFTMALTAYQWASGEDADNDGLPDTGVNIADNGTTPNYAATATVAPTADLAGPVGNVRRGATCTNAADINLVAGTGSANDWCYSEVGNVRLAATAANYLGSGVAVTGDSGWDGDAGGGYVGRFYPKSFALIDTPNLVNRTAIAACSSSAFTYMDEGFKLELTLEARNAQGAKTTHYTGTYARLAPSGNPVADYGLGARSGTTNLTGRLSGFYPNTTPAWSSGQLAVTGTSAITVSVGRKVPDDPDGPYAAMQIGIAPNDGDATISPLDQDVNNDAANDHKALGVGTEVRFGRLRLDNAFGNETHRLQVPMQVEYWNGSGFIKNGDDSCTSIPRSAIALTFDAPAVSQLAACETAVDADPVTFSAGVAPLGLSAPGVGNRGGVVLTVNLGTAGGSYCDPTNYVGAGSVAMPYLLGRWNSTNDDGNANTAYDDKPAARAGFGVYGSQPGNFIYFRERY